MDELFYSASDPELRLTPQYHYLAFRRSLDIPDPVSRVVAYTIPGPSLPSMSLNSHAANPEGKTSSYAGCGCCREGAPIVFTNKIMMAAYRNTPSEAGNELLEEHFLNPRLTRRTLDTYLIRRRILQAVQSAQPFLTGTLLDVGCGRMPYRSLLRRPCGGISRYVGVDLLSKDERRPDYGVPSVYWDGCSLPVKTASMDSALALEVLEHVPNPQVLLNEVARVLKPRAPFLLTVPFLWPLHDSPFDEYRYTPFALERHLRAAGFDVQFLEAQGGWDASLAQMIGLWIRRRPMNRALRVSFAIAALPLMRLLERKDPPPTDSSMITNIAALVRNRS